MQPASDNLLAQLFRPRSIALIGASDRNPFSQMAAENLERVRSKMDAQRIRKERFKQVRH